MTKTPRTAVEIGEDIIKTNYDWDRAQKEDRDRMEKQARADIRRARKQQREKMAKELEEREREHAEVDAIIASLGNTVLQRQRIVRVDFNGMAINPLTKDEIKIREFRVKSTRNLPQLQERRITAEQMEALMEVGVIVKSGAPAHVLLVDEDDEY